MDVRYLQRFEKCEAARAVARTLRIAVPRRNASVIRDDASRTRKCRSRLSSAARGNTEVTDNHHVISRRLFISGPTSPSTYYQHFRCRLCPTVDLHLLLLLLSFLRNIVVIKSRQLPPAILMTQCPPVELVLICWPSKPAAPLLHARPRSARKLAATSPRPSHFFPPRHLRPS